MRPYTPKDNVQKKAYYTDRFWVAPKVPREDAEGDATFGEDAAFLKAAFDVIEAYVEIGQLVVYVRPADVKKVLLALRDERCYAQLSEMSAIDFLESRGGFELFYQLLNFDDAKRMRLKCFLPKGESIQSVVTVYNSANWAEREMYDMFGVQVTNHPFFKRVIMPDDWVGHPLLKTYPLEGDESARWYEIDKIFGREARDEIGPENRDPAMVDPNDTRSFSRIGHEVQFGAKPSEEKTAFRYQEEKAPLLIKTFDPKQSKTLDKRK